MVKGQLVTTIDPVVALKELKGAVQRRVMRKAVRAGAKPLVAAMRAAAPKDTGTLKKSIGVRITTTRKKDVVAIVGPKRRFVRVVRGRKYVATKYRHLAERGRRAVRQGIKKGQKFKGKPFPIAKGIFRGSAGPARGRPFVGAAGNAAQQALAAVNQVVAAELAKEAQKAAAKARK